MSFLQNSSPNYPIYIFFCSSKLKFLGSGLVLLLRFLWCFDQHSIIRMLCPSLPIQTDKTWKLQLVLVISIVCLQLSGQQVVVLYIFLRVSSYTYPSTLLEYFCTKFMFGCCFSVQLFITLCICCSFLSSMRLFARRHAMTSIFCALRWNGFIDICACAVSLSVSQSLPCFCLNALPGLGMLLRLVLWWLCFVLSFLG